MTSTPDFKNMLRLAGSRATPGRERLLEALWREKKPLSVAVIQKKLGKKADMVTLYRSLEALAETGLIRRVDLGHDHAHYELQKKHHHHAVCTDCGLVKDVDACAVEQMQKSVAKISGFATISSHSLEFFGSCNSCVK